MSDPNFTKILQIQENNFPDFEEKGFLVDIFGVFLSGRESCKEERREDPGENGEVGQRPPLCSPHGWSTKTVERSWVNVIMSHVPLLKFLQKDVPS